MAQFRSAAIASGVLRQALYRGNKVRHCSRAWLLERLAISQQQHHSAERDERSNKPELFVSD